MSAFTFFKSIAVVTESTGRTGKNGHLSLPIKKLWIIQGT